MASNKGGANKGGAKLPGRTSTAGSGNTSKGKPVGFGVQGHPFRDIRHYNAAVSMAAKAGRKGPTPAKPATAGGGHAGGGGRQTANLSPSAQAHFKVAEVSKPTPSAKSVSAPRSVAKY